MNDKEIYEKLKPYLSCLKPCIVCGKSDFVEWAGIEYLNAKKCSNCSMISVNPHFTDEGLDEFYKEYFSKRLQYTELARQREEMYILDRDWVQNFINKGKVLDVGCSGGFFLEKFSPENWDRNGIEITKDAADFARNRLNIPVYTGKISDLDIPNDFDLIMLRGVIEHFSDPIGCLKKCAESLKKGGYLFITATPAGNSFSFYIYREKWRLFTPLEHIHYFSVDHLTKILEPIGFTLTARHYPYEETPYANPERDFIKMEKDIFYKFSGKWDQVESSSAFPGSMITAIWRKN